MEKKYQALRIMIWLYRLISIMVFIGGFGLGLLLAVSPTPQFTNGNSGQIQVVLGEPMTSLGIGLAIASIIVAISLWAFSELIRLLIDLEENTRASTKLLMRLAKGRE